MKHIRNRKILTRSLGLSLPSYLVAASLILVSVLSASVAAEEPSSIKTEAVSYYAGGVTLKGFLAYDAAVKERRPAVLVVHEWWGHNEYARKRATMLAELGYTALAVDMYGNGKQAAHPKQAGEFSSAVFSNLEQAKKRFSAALEFVRKHPTVDPQRTAAIGYCFGGGIVLHMARIGLDLDAVASFHGALKTQSPAKKDAIKAYVLVFNGAEDPMVSQEDLAAFKNEMLAAGASYQLVNYPGVKHSFTNPDATAIGEKFDLPLSYNHSADQQSWKTMQVVFKKIFAGPGS